MINSFRIKKHWIIAFCIMLFSSVSFAQQLGDQETGFNVEQAIVELKERGITDTEVLSGEIDRMRDMHIAQYLVMKAMEDKILQEIKSEQRTTRNLDIPPSEKEALLALYNSTNGVNWTNKTGWDFNTPVTNAWYGVTVIDGHVTSLSLATNKLTGVIPPEIGQLSQLQILSLYNNKLTGSIPVEIGQLQNLRYLNLGAAQLGNNALTGNIPVEIKQLLQLYYLNLSYNRLVGSVLSEIGVLNQLQILNLGYNRLSGSIPSSIGQLTNLTDLSLSNNQLSGSIPSSIGQVIKLQFLDLSLNKLSGSIPSEIKTLTQLQKLNLTFNQLSGSIPFEIEYLTNLTALYISHNSLLTGVIPSGIGQLTKLQMLDLSNNKLSGSIPLGIGQLTQVRTLRLGPNLIEGVVPDLSRLPAACRIEIHTSKFRFADFVQFISSNRDVSYRYQALIDTPKTITGGIGGTVTLKMYENDRYLPEETFQWYKNNQVIFGATSREYTIANITTTDVGSYYCIAKHPQLTIPGNRDRDLTLQRATITLRTVSCIPVTGEIQSESEVFYDDKEAVFTLKTTATNLSYSWSVMDTASKEVLESTSSDITESYVLNFPKAGEYTIKVAVTDAMGCTTIFTKEIIVTSGIKYCTEEKIDFSFETTAENVTYTWSASNAAGVEVNKITDTTGMYTFIPDEPGIYEIKLVASDANGCQSLFSEKVTVIICEPFCVSHIAIVVDESGSITPDEARKIKKQLKRYIQQQADDNDKLQSNIYVSLIGMSDGDIDTRTDHVQAVRVTNDPAVLKQFNNWIDQYGSRYGKQGISASSDYWKSGLDVALNSEMKPNIVMMITDGCQTHDVIQLRDETMSRFDNSKSKLDTSPDKPHLYVVGIENGFYVDSKTINGRTLVRNEDPNYAPRVVETPNETRVAPVLRTSLKFLLSYPETDFPQSSIDDFRGSDYFGHENFDMLGRLENGTFFADKLKLGQYICGDPADKDYCTDCLSFQPVPGKEYMLSAWVKEESFIQVKTYENAVLNVSFYNNVIANDFYKIETINLTASGDIIDGWQRISAKILIPEDTKTISVELENKSSGIPAYFDDIRIHPVDGSMKTFVYDSETFKLMSELDENNYSTFYEYDNEGGLVRIKKETAKGVKTIQETRSGNNINTQE